MPDTEPLPVDPAIVRHRLRLRLIAGRDKLNWTQAQVAEHLDCSTVKYMRIESGYVAVNKSDLLVLAKLYNFPDDVADLVDQARQISRHQTWSKFRDILSPPEIIYYGFEASAAHLRMYEPLALPPLLLAPDVLPHYVEVMSWPGTQPETFAQQLTFHRARLRQLQPPGPDDGTPGLNLDPRRRLHMVLFEGAMWRACGGPRRLARLQLPWLVHTAERPNITLQILPFWSGFGPTVNTFTVLTTPGRPDHDYVHLTRNVTWEGLTAEHAINHHEDAFAQLVEMSLTPGDSLDMLRELAAQLQTPDLSPLDDIATYTRRSRRQYAHRW